MLVAPEAAVRQFCRSCKSSTRFSTPLVTWCHSLSGLMSTPRITSTPCAIRPLTRCPPINPPAPQTTARSLFRLIPAPVISMHPFRCIGWHPENNTRHRPLELCEMIVRQMNNAPPIRQRSRPWRNIQQQPLAAAGILLLAGFVACAVFAPWLAPQDPAQLDLGGRLLAPGHGHWFGTDELGRDILSRTLFRRADLAGGCGLGGLALALHRARRRARWPASTAD